MAIPNFVYDVSAASVATITTLAWTYDLTACPAPTYALIDTSTGTTPVSAFFIATGNVLKVQSTTPSTLGTYNIEVYVNNIGTDQ